MMIIFPKNFFKKCKNKVIFKNWLGVSLKIVKILKFHLVLHLF